jgi:hypothetical protein
MTVVVTQLIEPRYIEMAASDMKARVEIMAQHQPFSVEGVHFQWNGKSYTASGDTDHVAADKVRSIAGKMGQRYAYHATCETLAEKGFTLATEEVEKTGAIRLTMRRIA